MIRVRPEDIYVLRNSTGRPLTDHLDRLIRSSASVVGIAAAAASDNPRTNVADGGADTEVSAPATLQDRWGYFGVPSVWQYKAAEIGSLTDQQIAEEINAPSKQCVLRAFDRTIEAVSSGALPPRYFENFKASNGQRHTNSPETKIVCETLMVLAKNSNAEAANIGLEFLQFLFMRNQDREKLVVLTDLFGEHLADVVFGLLEGSVPSKGRISHTFAGIFTTVMELDPQRAVKLVMQLLRHK